MGQGNMTSTPTSLPESDASSGEHYHQQQQQDTFFSPGDYSAEQQWRFGARVAESILDQMIWLQQERHSDAATKSEGEKGKKKKKTYNNPDKGEDEAAAAGTSCINDEEEAVLGQLLMDFFHLFGEELGQSTEGISIRAGGFRFPCKLRADGPLHPLASDPWVLEDPISVTNNVARSCYRIHAVQQAFFEALSNLQSLVVRFNEGSKDGRINLLSPRATPSTFVVKESILVYICNIDLESEQFREHHLEKDDKVKQALDEVAKLKIREKKQEIEEEEEKGRLAGIKELNNNPCYDSFDDGTTSESSQSTSVSGSPVPCLEGVSVAALDCVK